MSDRSAQIELNDGDLLLTGGSVSYDLKPRLVAGGDELRRTMEGASTLTVTVDDDDRGLFDSGLLERDSETTLSGLRFRLVGVERQADRSLSLEFEDREVALLRDKNRKRKASRGKVTRARFAKTLVDEIPSIGFIAPEGVDKRQSIAERKKTEPDLKTVNSYRGGIADNADLKVKGKKATPEQIELMEQVLAVAVELNAGPKATKALVEACIVESVFRNPKLGEGDLDSIGILQIRASTAAGKYDPGDPEASARQFLENGFYSIYSGGGAIPAGRRGAKDIARDKPNFSAGQVAQSTQGSKFPLAYDIYGREADAIIKAYNGDFSQVDSSTRTYSKAFEFSRGKPGGPSGEDTWDCLQRLASEVRWRCFMREGVVYFASDTTLAKDKPSLVVAERGGEGEKVRKGLTLANSITFQLERLDERQQQRGKYRKRLKRVSECVVTCEAALWKADPGSVVLVEQMGPANGKWLVWEVTRGLYDPTTVITLRRPQPALPEPAAETVTKSRDGGSTPEDDSQAAPTDGQVGYPLADKAKMGGGPAEHKLRPFGNWQSDNAVDLLIRQGVAVLAVDDGEIVRLGGAWRGGSGNPDGFNVTIKTSDNAWFYTHLKTRAPNIQVGKKVKRGEYLGSSGAANGVDHIHLGVEKGDPVALLGSFTTRAKQPKPNAAINRRTGNSPRR